MSRDERLRSFDAAPAPVVTPSILSCDFAVMADVFAQLESAGAVAAHLDVMDGHFVPNLSYGPPVIKDWRPRTTLTFDAHLMIDDPERYVQDYINAGCDQITVHIEVLPDPRPLLERIRSSGCRAGLSLNPPTPLSAIEPYLEHVDKVLVMSVMPGFGGQSFDASVRQKIKRLRTLNPKLPIAVDGGIKTTNAAEVADDGATQLVVGSGIFRPGVTVAEALAELNAAARARP